MDQNLSPFNQYPTQAQKKPAKLESFLSIDYSD